MYCIRPHFTLPQESFRSQVASEYTAPFPYTGAEVIAAESRLLFQVSGAPLNQTVECQIFFNSSMS